jgi:hypothetical protein
MLKSRFKTSQNQTYKTYNCATAFLITCLTTSSAATMDAYLIKEYKQARDATNAAISRAWWTSLLAAYFFLQLLVFPEFRNGLPTAIAISLTLHIISSLFTCGRGGIIEYVFSFFHALALGYLIAALHDRLFGQTADRVVEIFCIHTVLGHQLLRENMLVHLKSEIEIMRVFHRAAAAYSADCQQHGTAQPTILGHVWQWYWQRFREILWNTAKQEGIQAAVLRWGIQQIYNHPKLENPPFRWVNVLALLLNLRYTLTGFWVFKRFTVPTLGYMLLIVLDLVELGLDRLIAVLP